MMRNMVTSLIEFERITTTLPKAKQLRRLADQMVTLAKRSSLHARRQAAQVVRSRSAVRKLFDELGPRFVGRNGGYTRILKLGNRWGDGAPMAFIEYLGYTPKAKVKAPVEKKPAKVKAKKETAKETKKTAKKEAKKAK
jgi:large subunit ribosomal protein L17